jgi:hypothetical protein
MTERRKIEAKDTPLVAPDEVRRLVGDVDDATVSEILRLGPTFAELEQALTYAEGEGSLADRAGHPLSGRVAELYDILTADEQSAEPER